MHFQLAYEATTSSFIAAHINPEIAYTVLRLQPLSGGDIPISLRPEDCVNAKATQGIQDT